MATLPGARASHVAGALAISLHAERSKQASFVASSQTVAHGAGTVTGTQPPVVVVAPMSRFQPAFTLTSAQRCIRRQLRAVQGPTQRRTIASTAPARASRCAVDACGATAKNPRMGASSSDSGRSSVASAAVTPAASSLPAGRTAVRARHARAAATTSSAEVTPSVITAAV
ncbi:MAG TPA: hypothetical protein VEK07_22595 [Polyangiaceae bacterium]|nr:hypothetical protein [Polyangiaceae bacterium]